MSVAIDAQRGQVFAAEFDRSEAVWRLRGEPCVLNNEDWVKRFSRDVAASGPALGKLASQLPTDVAIAAPQRWNPRAATVAALAWERHLQGMYDDVWRLAPLYLRKSAAEEKWEQRQR